MRSSVQPNIIPNASQMPANRLPCLDGWRAISILLVLIQHSAGMPGWPPSLRNQFIAAVGGVGVRFFFVISGFLITWLLLKEIEARGEVSLKSFYARRALRIFPVLAVYFGVMLLVNEAGLISTAYGNFAIAGLFMCDIWETGQPLTHLWSLGVEEKFYLFWPLIFVILMPGRVKKLLRILLGLLVLAPFIRAGIDYWDLDASFLVLGRHSFLTIYDGLAMGCVGAILLEKRRSFIVKMSWLHRYWLFCIGLILMGLPALFWFFQSLRELKPLQDTLQCCGFLLLMLQSICHPGFWLYRPLSFGLVARLGVISYSLYIWMGLAELHSVYSYFPFLQDYVFPVWLLVSVVLAEASYRFVEGPIIARRGRIFAMFGLGDGAAGRQKSRAH